MRGGYEGNYKKIQRFLAKTRPKEQLKKLFNEEAVYVIGDPTEIERLYAYKTSLDFVYVYLVSVRDSLPQNE